MNMTVTYELTKAYEVWTVEVPEGTTHEQILDGTADVEFVCLDDSGNTYMQAVEVED